MNYYITEVFSLQGIFEPHTTLMDYSFLLEVSLGEDCFDKRVSLWFFLSVHMPHICQNKARLSPPPMYTGEHKRGAEDKSPPISHQEAPLKASYLLLSSVILWHPGFRVRLTRVPRVSNSDACHQGPGWKHKCLERPGAEQRQHRHQQQQRINKLKIACLYTSKMCSNYNSKKGNKTQWPQTT